ncbi:MAG: ATP-grasp domain-containing protein [Gulosibacter sp.]|uniref:ATP-grasp domain-containing protein n=1 Tax=Gulosibacter sp. TaxID=2817531 RepID=UPI003F91E2DC
MNNPHGLKIVIASAGRRAHYIEWFKKALRNQDLHGEIIAMEFRETSPTFAIADRAVQTPAYNSAEYAETLLSWFAVERPTLFLCLNDYEMQMLSGHLSDRLRSLGCTVAVLAPAGQDVVIDKLQMSKVLRERGIPTPNTYSGADLDAVAASVAAETKFIVKHRFGSGSVGLQIATARTLPEAVATTAATALTEDGHSAESSPEAVVVQDYLPGSEFGVDGVFSLDGRSELLGVVARCTEQIRDGDPEVATSVHANRFHDDMAAIGKLLNPTGPINVDFRETHTGEPQVIDINPRLGGGYPFNHRAGANLPAALVRLAAGLDHDPKLLEYELDVTTARREEFTVISR